MEAFRWVGLDYDGPVVYQSSRFPLYREYLERLLEEGKAYKCYLTPEELEQIREARLKGEKPPVDPRKYRDFKGELDKPYVIRFKTPLDRELYFEDQIKGEQRIKGEEIEDFVLARSDGTPTYNFVVVVDDHLMGVTDVIRGDDHLRNTFKQLLLYEAFGWTPPTFYHVPMIHNEAGKKMSKRDGAVDVLEYRRAGYLPEALLNFLVRLGWSYGDREIFSIEEMVQLFDPTRINRSPARFDQEKLDWLNSYYIKQSSNDRLRQLLKGEFGVEVPEGERGDWLLEELKGRVKRLKEMGEEIEKLFTRPTQYNPKAVKRFLKPKAVGYLKELLQEIEERGGELKTPVDWEEFLQEFLSRHQGKPREVMPPLRIGLTGDTKGIDLGKMLAILGPAEVQTRLAQFLEWLEGRGE